VILGVGTLAVVVVAWYHDERGVPRVTGPELIVIGMLLCSEGSGWLSPAARARVDSLLAPVECSYPGILRRIDTFGLDDHDPPTGVLR
jgi:hypothetical protein